MERFFIFCAGEEYSVLRGPEFSRDKMRIAAAGVTIFLVGVFASISGGFAIYKIFGGTTNPLAPYFAVPLGLLWGWFIFSMDRLIVMTIESTDELYIKIFKLIPRLAIACLIAISVSKPLEIFLLSNSIKAKQTQDALEEKTANRLRMKETLGTEGIDSRISDYNHKLFILIGQKGQEPETITYQSNKAEKKRLEKEISNLRVNFQLTKNKKKDLERQYPEFTEDGESGRPQSVANQIGALSRRINGLGKRIARSNTSLERVKEDMLQEANSRKNELQKIQEELSLDKSNLSRRKDSLAQEYTDEITKSDVGTDLENSEGFVTELRTAARLTKWDETPGADNSYWWISTILTSLFMLIEIVPVGSKIFIKTPIYDKYKKDQLDSATLKYKQVQDQLTLKFRQNMDQMKLETIKSNIKGMQTLKEDSGVSEHQKLQEIWIRTYANLLQKELTNYSEPDMKVISTDYRNSQATIDETSKTDEA